MVDYTIPFLKIRSYPSSRSPTVGTSLFLHLTPSDRVTDIFDRVHAQRKIWVIHQEYGLAESELPTNGELFQPSSADESEVIGDLFKTLGKEQLSTKRICVDITGFMRPHMLFLIRWLERNGVAVLDVLYSEPQSYRRREMTEFSKGSIQGVRQVAGYAGIANRDMTNDYLIVGAGYDDRLIAEVAEHKDTATKIVMFGLPSLRVDMYQQNLLRTYNATEALGSIAERHRRYAPANDPFVTASVLSEISQREENSQPITNLYLSPLATKPQALGFALFYIGERDSTNTSIIFPFSSGYEKETGIGLSRTWRYTVEFLLLTEETQR